MAEKKSLSRRTFIKGAMGFAGLAALGAGVSFLPRTELMRTIENKKTQSAAGQAGTVSPADDYC